MNKESKQGSPRQALSSGGRGLKGPRPKGPLWPVLKRLIGYMMAYKRSVALISVGFLFSTLLSLAPSFILKLALDRFLSPDRVLLLWLSAGAMILSAVFQGAADFMTRYLAERRGQEAVYRIRQDFYHRLLEMSFSYFDRARTGDLLSRITADAESLQGFFGFAGVYIISNTLFMIGILAVLLSWSLQLSLVYLALMPFVVFGITRYAFRVRPAFGRIRQALSALNEHIHEQLRAVPLIRTFGREKETLGGFDRENIRYQTATIEAGRITAFWMPYVTVFIGLGTGLVLWYGGLQVIGETLSLGTLVGFSSYITMMRRPIRQTGMLVSRTMMAAAAAERVFEILDAEPEVRDLPGATDVARVRGDVSFHEVSFSYDGKTPVLQGVSFSVKAGETVAVVGPTGAGKTTLVHLLPRFYNADSGEIRIDDRPIGNFTLKSLRGHIGVVLQQAYLFNMSLRDNIAFGRPDATMDDIRHAAQVADIDTFIMSLPRGYDTVVGERGVRLSGGQRQRISIARTLLTDPAILILDEPTSSVDSDTDERIQEALDELTKSRTVFVIAHRLWTLRRADRILVIDDGRALQYGTHEELVSTPGLYRDIYTLQVRSELYDIEPEEQPGQEGV